MRRGPRSSSRNAAARDGRRALDGGSSRSAEGPWFCWVHLYEPHYPYEPPAAVTSRFRNPYHGDVSAADAALQPLLAPILSAGRDGRTLVVLTSDHGESLGEHGEATHGVFAYEAALKVPLIIYQPRLVPAAVIDRPAQHIDLLPTILDAVAPRSRRQGFREKSAARRWPVRERLRTAPTYFEALSASLTRGWAPLDGVVVDSMKYIELPIPELYDLNADPAELKNLASSEPARVEALRSRLQQLRGPRAAVAADPESRETRERLQSLGYVAGNRSGARTAFTEADDPKRLIAFDARVQEIVSQYLAGDLQGALVLCRALLRERPDMPLTLFHLALLERENGNLEAAIGALRKAIAIVPDDAATAAMLGASLTQAGRPAEAVALLDPFARREHADLEVLTARALALAKLQRFDEALAALSRARTEDPSNGRLLLEVGTVHLMAGQRDRAREAWNRALALNPNLARVYTSLGVLSLEERRPAEAIEHWKAATLLDPRESLDDPRHRRVARESWANGRGRGGARLFRGACAAGAVCRRARASARRARDAALESGGRAGPRPTRVIGCDCRVDDPAADPCTGAGRAESARQI